MIKLLDIVDELLVEAYRPEQLAKAFDKWLDRQSKESINLYVDNDPKLYNQRYKKTFNEYMRKKDKFIKLYPFFINKDLFKMSLRDFDAALNRANEQSLEKNAQKAKEGVDFVTIYSDGTIKILAPLTHKGSCKTGYGAQWCTSMVSTSEYWDRYYKDSIFFRIIYLGTNHKISFIYGVSGWLKGKKVYTDEQDNQQDAPELPKNAWNAIEKYYQQHKNDKKPKHVTT